jgi:hypothetical protein
MVRASRAQYLLGAGSCPLQALAAAGAARILSGSGVARGASAGVPRKFRLLWSAVRSSRAASEISWGAVQVVDE